MGGGWLTVLMLDSNGNLLEHDHDQELERQPPGDVQEQELEGNRLNEICNKKKDRHCRYECSTCQQLVTLIHVQV